MSNIPFRIKKLTETAKLPEKANEGDLFDLFADRFCAKYLHDMDCEFVNDDLDYAYGSETDKYCNISNIGDEHLRGQLSDVNLKGLSRELLSSNHDDSIIIYPQGRILIKTGIALELPIRYIYSIDDFNLGYSFGEIDKWQLLIDAKKVIVSDYAVADLRPRSGLALKHGITVLNAPATIDNSYRKEIGVILYNAGHEPYTIKKGDKIAQMLIRPLYPSSFEVVKDFEDTGRGGYGSTGK